MRAHGGPHQRALRRTPAHPPIVLKVEHHEPQDVYEYYRAADLCMVTSLHDGMNLVAKEFVSARDDERGVLILSQFTGAARELPEAIIVNPYDTDQCAAALHLALDDAGGRAARPHAADARADPGVQRVSLGGPHADRCRGDAAARPSPGARRPGPDGRARPGLVTSLDLALVGNGTIGALIDPGGEIVWTCFPRFDGDPAFCSLLQPDSPGPEFGFFGVDLIDPAGQEQEYLANTPILVTRLHDKLGGAVEITDCAPRFRQYGRMFCPMTLVRQIRRIAGNPRVRVRLRPAHHGGAHAMSTTCGSNHIRYIGTDLVLRLTTDASVTAIGEETPFFLEDTITLLLGPDETVQGAVADVGRRFVEETIGYWREWVRYLGIPFEWQDAVIRAAITLKLNAFEDTGAIDRRDDDLDPRGGGHGPHLGLPLLLAARRLFRGQRAEPPRRHAHDGALPELHRQRRRRRARGRRLQPVYGISGRAVPEERTVSSLAGYRGMGPVRVGNQAARAGAARRVRLGDSRRDPRVLRPPPGAPRRSGAVRPPRGAGGARGAPLRPARRRHLGAARHRAGAHLLQRDVLGRVRPAGPHRDPPGPPRAGRLLARPTRHASTRWSPGGRGTPSASASSARWTATPSTRACCDCTTSDFSRPTTRASPAPSGRSSASCVTAISSSATSSRTTSANRENAFIVCTFWYINALAALGRRDEARALFENLLACRNRHGLLAEHIDPRTREQWGNFVQTYSMVGIIGSAIRLSIRWDQAF